MYSTKETDGGRGAIDANESARHGSPVRISQQSLLTYLNLLVTKKLFIVMAMIIGTVSTSYVMGQSADKSFWACQGGLEMINPNSTEYVAIFEGSSNYEAVKDSYREQFCAYLKQNKVADEMIARHRTGPMCQCTQMQDAAMSKWFLPQLRRQSPAIPYEEIVWFPGHD